MSMEHEKRLNDRTLYSIIPNFSVVLRQDDQTIVLSNEELTKLFIAIGTADEDKEYDARKKGCQA